MGRGLGEKKGSGFCHLEAKGRRQQAGRRPAGRRARGEQGALLGRGLLFSFKMKTPRCMTVKAGP